MPLNFNLFKYYIYSLPFIWSFTILSGRLTPTILISLLMFLIVLINLNLYKLNFSKCKLLLVFLYLLSIFLSFFLSNKYNQSTFLHAISYVLSFFFFYLIPLIYTRLNYQLIGEIPRYCFNLVIGLTFFIFLEFSLTNFFSVDLHSYLLLPSDDLPDSSFLGRFIRPRGFAPEPGHLSLLIEILLFISLIYLEKSSLFIKISFITFTYLGVCLTASVSGLLIIPLSYILSIIIVYRKNLIIFKIILNLLFLTIFILIIYYSNIIFIFNEFIDDQIILKFDSTSALDRINRVNIFLDIVSNFTFFNYFFGVGPGIVSILNLSDSESIINLYLLVFSELGILGIFLLLFFFYSSLKIYNDQTFNPWISICTLGAVVVVSMHFLLIANYWYPYFWLPFLFLNLFTFYKK